MTARERSEDRLWRELAVALAGIASRIEVALEREAEPRGSGGRRRSRERAPHRPAHPVSDTDKAAADAVLRERGVLASRGKR